MSIAPWQVQICNLRATDEHVNEVATALYETLQSRGVEVLYDDRDIRAGAMFADADLFGIPLRIVVSPKTCERGAVEYSLRDKSEKGDYPIEQAADRIEEKVKEMLAVYNV